MRSIVLTSLVLALAGCDPTTAPADAPTSDVPSTDAPGADVPGSDAGTGDGGGGDGGGSDAAMACVPTGGPATGGAYCDRFELALFTYDDAPPRVELHGRVEPDDVADGDCWAVDEVEVQVGGATIAMLEGEAGMIASGAAFDELTARCEGVANRFGGFGFLVHGTRDGGTFTGECADAEGGSRWPPAVTVTCHHNIERPAFSAYAMVTSSSFGPSSTIDVSMVHGPGGALTGVDGTIQIIPGFATAFGATASIDPYESTGWSGTASESTAPIGTYSLLQLRQMIALPSELCPGPGAEPPGPGVPPPPVFLVGLSGDGERGAFRTEALVNGCYTIIP